MKKLFLGLGLASLALLAACGGKDDKKDSTDVVRKKVVAKTDDTDKTSYTATTGAAIYSSLEAKNLYDFVSVDYSIISKYNDETASANGTAAFKYHTTLKSWEYDVAGSTNGALAQKETVASYTFDKFDGLYDEYNQLVSAFDIQEYETVNWYTKNSGGYRVVALSNEDYNSTIMIFEWDKDGYRISSNALTNKYDKANNATEMSVQLNYRYEALK